MGIKKEGLKYMCDNYSLLTMRQNVTLFAKHKLFHRLHRHISPDPIPPTPPYYICKL